MLAPSHEGHLSATFTFKITEEDSMPDVLRWIAASALAAMLSVFPVLGFAAEVDEAIALLKQTHDDQCEQQKLRGRLLIAHQAHDSATLEALTPKLEALNARMKPSADKLKELTAKFSENSQDRNAFENAQIEMGSCD
jgi:hypothetical protein